MVRAQKYEVQLRASGVKRNCSRCTAQLDSALQGPSRPLRAAIPGQGPGKGQQHGPRFHPRSAGARTEFLGKRVLCWGGRRAGEPEARRGEPRRGCCLGVFMVTRQDRGRARGPKAAGRGRAALEEDAVRLLLVSLPAFPGRPAGRLSSPLRRRRRWLLLPLVFLLLQLARKL